MPNFTEYKLELVQKERICDEQFFVYRCNASGDNVFEKDPYRSELKYQCNKDGSLPTIEFLKCTDNAICTHLNH